MDAIKGALLSKTVWFNGIISILGVIDWLQAHQGMVGLALQAAGIGAAGPAFAIVGAVGVILRAVTSQPLAAKATPSGSE